MKIRILENDVDISDWWLFEGDVAIRRLWACAKLSGGPGWAR